MCISVLLNSSLPGEKLPFTLKDVRAAIPAHCFVPSVTRSLSYFFWDTFVIVSLAGLAYWLNAWWFYPIYWIAQGTMLWALFVVGHDCGHGSFSPYPWLNSLIGHLSHIPILVPYHGWRISHRTHHANTGNIETDESWYPVTEAKYQAMPWYEKLFRFYLPLLAFPIYLVMRSPGRQGSHFLPNSPIFRPSEKWDVLTSSGLWLLMAAFWAFMTYTHGWWMVKLYWMPYLGFVIWLDLVTYLHHTEADIPWYPNEDWYFLKGAISTIDRDYGIINKIHHNIGTHVAHHIFLTIPHYHLLEATEAIKPVLGEYYRSSTEPIWQSFVNSYRNCHFVPNEGKKLFYQKAE
ncbi:MAG: fatty acid desaturase [Cyanobacteria bacterium M5B4]|nr:MAG: fatty acid desaturase [Cyanobacteria bacterium M5B4]